MNATLTSPLAALCHNLGTYTQGPGESHVDAEREGAGWAYLLVDSANPGVSTQGWPVAVSADRVQSDPQWSLLLRSEDLRLTVGRTAVFDIPYTKVPGDWLDAARRQGAVILAAVPNVSDPLSVADRIEELIVEPLARAIRIQVALEPSPSPSGSDIARDVAATTKLTQHPGVTVASAPANWVIPPTFTLRSLHSLGLVPPALASVSASRWSDEQGALHSKHDCPAVTGDTRFQDMLLSQALSTACPRCAPGWDTPLTEFDDWSVKNACKPALDALDALRYRPTGPATDFLATEDAFSAALRLYSDFRYDTDPGALQLMVAAVAGLLEVGQAVLEGPTIPAGAERALVLTADPSLDARMRAQLDGIYAGLGDMVRSAVMRGGEPTLYVAAYLGGQWPEHHDHLRQAIRDALAPVDSAVHKLHGRPTWVLTRASIGPVDGLARLASRRWMSVTNPRASATLMAVPEPAAALLIRSAQDTDRIGLVWDGETYEFAQAVITGNETLYAHEVRKRMEALREERKASDPVDPIGWRNFARADGNLY